MAGYSDVSALGIDGWTAEVQPYLMKSLVGREVADTSIADDLKQGMTVYYPQIGTGSITVADYTAGSALTATAATAGREQLDADQRKVASTYIDDVNALQTNYAFRNEVTKRMAYKIKDGIDQRVFSATHGALSGSTAHVMNTSYQLGATGTAITASTANIVEVFTNARRILRNNKVYDSDLAAVVDYDAAEIIERTAIEKGFNLADTTLKNGYAGSWLGFDVYLSPNLETDGSMASGSATSADMLVFGKKGGMDLAVQKEPTMDVRKPSDQLGVNVHMWSVYGTKVFADKKDFLLEVPVKSL